MPCRSEQGCHVDREPLQLSSQGTPRNAQDLRGFALATSGLLEGEPYDVTLGPVDVVGEAERGFGVVFGAGGGGSAKRGDSMAESIAWPWGQRAVKRIASCWSSRTFPGHAYRVSWLIALTVTPRMAWPRSFV